MRLPQIDEVAYIRSLLRDVTYRPGWTIEAYPTPYWDRVWILIDAEVLDSERYDPSLTVDENYRAGNTTRVGVRAVVPEFDDLGRAFYDWLGARLIRCERHESREFFQVGGAAWDSPHKRPQPPFDYWVAKHPVSNRWCVWRAADNTVVESETTWHAAYRLAWWHVIQDDGCKGQDMING